MFLFELGYRRSFKCSSCSSSSRRSRRSRRIRSRRRRSSKSISRTKASTEESDDQGKREQVEVGESLGKEKEEN